MISQCMSLRVYMANAHAACSLHAVKSSATVSVSGVWGHSLGVLFVLCVRVVEVAIGPAGRRCARARAARCPVRPLCDSREVAGFVHKIVGGQ